MIPFAKVKRRFGYAAAGVAGFLYLAAPCRSAALVYTTSPYLSQADSTLNIASPSYYFEDFESGAITVPGVSVTALPGSGIQTGLSIENGASGKNYAGATTGNQQNTAFNFSQVAGQWPRQVAIAVTNGVANSVAFSAYDPSSNLEGGLTMNVSVSSLSDAFLVTFIDNAGISKISMVSNNAFTYLHYDDLQFDTAPAAVPEPAGLLGMAVAAIAFSRRRRRPNL